MTQKKARKLDAMPWEVRKLYRWTRRKWNTHYRKRIVQTERELGDEIRPC